MPSLREEKERTKSNGMDGMPLDQRYLPDTGFHDDDEGGKTPGDGCDGDGAKTGFP